MFEIDLFFMLYEKLAKVTFLGKALFAILFDNLYDDFKDNKDQFE